MCFISEYLLSRLFPCGGRPQSSDADLLVYIRRLSMLVQERWLHLPLRLQSPKASSRRSSSLESGMEGYPYSNYPESGDSSPQCRDIDGENAISWDETPQPATVRVKLMCSYGGRIQPRPHDNQLSYFGGETKILAVERSIPFPAFVAKLASLYGAASPEAICIKYQLPGEDLDALISVTNDEDLDHMMIEYDRLHLCSGKPAARLRLFLFPANPSTGSAASSVETEKKTDRMCFLETLLPMQSSPAMDHNPLQSPPTPPPSLLPDFLSSIVPPPARVEAKDLTSNNVVAEPLPVDALSARSDQGMEETLQIRGETVITPPSEVQSQIQDIQRLQISENQYLPPMTMQRNSSDEVVPRVYHGEYYSSGVQEKTTLAPPSSVTTQFPTAYWTDQHGMIGARFTSAPGGDQLPIYLIPPQTLYPSTAGHAYYPPAHPSPGTFSRVLPTDIYQNLPPLYPTAPPPQQIAKVIGAQYTEASAPLRSPAMDAAMVAAYGAGKVAYDSMGRPVFYPGGIATYHHQAVTSVARTAEANTSNTSQIS